ncbi:hypothetical protein [Natrinema sp. 74]|uniref:DUF7312 domain-containing protein n=1 Tax=Natrinema sp. 74 TaxID=3384159 RepID=UPI0038D37AF5
MADDSSGRDDTDDRWGSSSATDPDAGPVADSSDDEWGGSDRPTVDTEGRDDGWDRIPIDLSDSSETDEPTETDDGDEYVPEANSTPIEPGDPDLENVLFVILGAIAMVLVFVRLISIPLG